MSTTHDALIKRALTPDESVRAPVELGDAIYRAVIATPQHRSALSVLFGGRPQLSPALRMALLVLLLAALLGASLVALSQVLHKPSVLMYRGGPERTGVMPGPGPVGNPVVDWRLQLHGAVPFAIAPLVVDGQVIVADDSGTVWAVDEQTGELNWSVNIGSPIGTSPVIVGGQVIVGSVTGSVVALDVGDGHEFWQTTLTGRISAAPVAVGNVLYIGTQNGDLYQLDARSGTYQSDIAIGAAILRGPAVADGVIYVGVDGGNLRAIRTGILETIWSVELGRGGVGTPAVSDGSLFVGHGIDAVDPPRGLVAVSLTDGSVSWSFASPEEVQVHIGAVGVDRVFGVSDDQSVYALDKGTGSVEWTHATGGAIASLAALAGDALYVSSTDQTVRSIDVETGALLWSIEVEGEPTSPVVINGRVYVGTTRGWLVAIGGEDGP